MVDEPLQEIVVMRIGWAGRAGRNFEERAGGGSAEQTTG